MKLNHKDKCHYCGQVIDAKIFQANAVKIAKANGIPSFAKLLEGIDYEN